MAIWKYGDGRPTAPWTFRRSPAATGPPHPGADTVRGRVARTGGPAAHGELPDCGAGGEVWRIWRFRPLPHPRALRLGGVPPLWDPRLTFRASVVPSRSGCTARQGRPFMPDPMGFMKYRRQLPLLRPVPERVGDWRDVYRRVDEQMIHEQSSRCMNCGVPY